MTARLKPANCGYHFLWLMAFCAVCWISLPFF